MSFTFPTKPKASVLGTDKVNPETGLSFPDTGSKFTGDISSPIDISRYKRFFPEGVHTEFGQEYLDPIRAARQTGFEQLGAGVLQSAGEVVGGTIEGLGYLGDVPQTVNAIKGVEEDWGNWLSDIGIAMKTWTRDVAPIYQDPSDIGKFRPGKWSWWMSNAPSVASTLSLMIPATGAVKGVSMLGKAMGIGTSMGKTARFMSTSVGQAVASRLMENGMEASQAFDQTYNQLLEIGIPEQEARRAAGVQASDLWNKEWIMMVQDIPQYMLLGSGISKSVAPVTRPVAKKLGLNKSIVRNINLRNTTSLLGDALSEGGEEVFQFILSDRASHLARAAVDNDYDYKPSAGEYIRDGELWTSFVMGALGSTVFQTAGRKINKLIQGDTKDVRVENIASWAPEIKLYSDALKTAKSQGNEKAAAETASDLAITLAAKASVVGNIQVLKDTLIDMKNNAVNEEKANSLGITPDTREFIVNNYDNIINDINNTSDAYETYSRKYDNDISARLAANDVRRKRTLDKLNAYKENRSKIEKDIIGFNSLSVGKQQMEKASSAIRSMEKLKSFYQERLDNDQELSKKEKANLSNDIKSINKSVESLKKTIENADKNRSQEEKESDSKINIKSAALDNYFDNDKNISEVEAQLNTLDYSDSDLRKAQTDRRKGNKRKKYKEPDLSSDNAKDREVIDSDVVSTDEDVEVPEEQSEIESIASQQADYENMLSRQKRKREAEKKERLKKSKIENPSEPKFKENKAKQEDVENLDDFIKADGETATDEYFDVDENGNVIVDSDKKETHSEDPEKDDSIPMLTDDPSEVLDTEYREFDPLKDSSVFINIGGDKIKVNNKFEKVTGDNRSEAQKYLDNPKKRISSSELIFTIDYGEFFNNEFGDNADSIRKRIQDGDKTLLYSDDKLSSIVDRIPIKANIRSKRTKKELDGDFYIYKSSTKVPKANKLIQDEISQSTSSLRQKIIEGILNNTEVTVSNFKRSTGKPNRKGENLNVIAALDIDPKTVQIGISKPGGNIIDSSGNALPGKSRNIAEPNNIAKGGNAYVYVNTTVNGELRPIKLNNSKLSEEHARLIFDAYEQAARNKSNFSIKFSDKENRTSSMTVSQLLDVLVYNGKKNTEQNPNDTNRLYREELIPKQLWLNKAGILIYGDNNVNMLNYTEDQKQSVINHLTENMNYVVRMSHLDTKIKKPFRIGSIEVTENDVSPESAITWKQLYLENSLLTTNSQIDENGSTHEASDLFVEYSDIDSINYNDIKATETKVEEKKVSNIEVKKADVEKRRKESIRVFTPPYSEITLYDEGYFENDDPSKAFDFADTRLVSNQKDGLQKINDYYDKELFRIDDFDTSGAEKETQGLSNINLEELDSLRDILDDEMGIEKTRVFEGNYNYERGNIEEESKWIRNKLGQEYDPQIVDDFIKVVSNTGSRLAYGSLKDGSIKLYKYAEEGTGYHEAFHVVSLYYLTDTERNTIYKEARERFNKTDYTDAQIEELLAEEFRKFVLTEKKIEIKPGAIKRFFNRLYNFIRDIFIRPETRIQDLTINSLFERIENGEYKKAKVKPENLSRYVNYETLREVEGFSSTQVHSITKQLLYQTVRKNNIIDLENIQDIDYRPVKEWVDELLNRLEDRKNISDKDKKVYNIFSRVKDNFDTFKSLLDDMLLSMDIRKVIEFDEDYTINEFDKHTKERYEYSSRGNMLDNIKLFISTIPSDDIDSFTEMHTIVDFDKAWRKIMRDLHDASNPQEMIDRLVDKAKDSLFYKTLLEGNKHRPGLKTASENFRTQFFTSIKKHKYHFLRLVANTKNKTYTFYDAEMTSLSGAMVEGWSNNFLEDKGLFHKTTFHPNKKVFRSIIGNFESLERNYSREYLKLTNKDEVPNFDKYIDSILKILNDIGITASADDIHYILSKKGESKSKSLKDFISNELNNIFNSTNSFMSQFINDDTVVDKNKSELFKRSKSINKLGELIADNNEENVASVVMGPEGNQYYMYSENSFITDYIDNLSYDENFVNLLYNSVGKKNSFYLNQIKGGSEISLSTFLGYKEEKTTVDYFDMTPEEDYLMKSVAVLDNRLPLPTISDKKFYGYINGINRVVFTPEKTKHDAFESGAYLKENEQGKLVYEFPDDLYTIFNGYYQDELDRISKVKSDIERVEEDLKGDNPENLYEDLIENYHFVGYTEEGLPKLRDEKGVFTGNGTKLIDFKEFENKEFNRENLKKMFVRIVNDEIRAAKNNEVIKVEFNDRNRIVGKSIKNLKLPKYWVDLSKEHFGKNEAYGIYNVIADVALNSVITNIEVTKLFSMDPAFYDGKKGDIFDDVTKRLSEIVAPGQNLRINFTEDEFNAGVMESDSYVSGTLRSHEFSSNNIYEDLKSKFTKDYKKTFKDVMTDEDIERVISNKLKAYKNIDTTDGQVLISPQLYRQIAIRLGEWDNNKNLAFERILSDTESSIAKISSDIETVMQPLKMVYYGISFFNGHAVPTYDKMSLAILLPQMVKGTKLQELYDFMTDENNPVPMIKFDSAVKTGTTYVTDYLTEDNKIDNKFKLNIVTKKQPFKYLRRQQVTDPHKEERRMVGTQVKKIILQNLRSEKAYNLGDKKLTGNDIADLISKLYSSLSNIGKNKIDKILGSKDGELNVVKLYKVLKNSALMSGMPYNIIDSLSIDKNTGKPYANLDTMPDRRWTESRLISQIGKSTVDLMTAGDSFIQMSSFGTSSFNSTEAADLKLYDKKGRTEVKLSVGLFKDVIPNYKELTFSEKKEWLNKNFEGIGYRIPTQSQGSVISMIVKDFLPEETGNTIMLPLEFTALTGSDFDIDKLFLMRKSYYTDINNDIQEYKFIEGDENNIVTENKDLEDIYRQVYASKIRAIDSIKQEILENKIDRYSNFIKAIERKLGVNEAFEVQAVSDVIENIKREDMINIISRLDKDILTLDEFISKNKDKNAFEINHPKAMENLIIDVMKSVVTSDSHVIDTKTPIDAHTTELKNILEELDSIRGKTETRKGFQWYTLSEQNKIKQFYIGGKFGIGPFALHNVHHALTQVSNMGIVTNLKPYSDKKFDLNPDKNNLAKVYDRDGNLITDWFSGLINAHVDIAKDPYIFRLNVIKDTYNQLSYLLRLGFGKSAFYYINQPSIVENPDSFKSKSESKKYMKKATVLAKDEKIPTEDIEKLRDIWASLSFVLKHPGLLLKQIDKNTKRDARWHAQQAGILLAYNKISGESAKLSNLVQLSRIDSKGYGNNIGQIRSFDRRMQNMLLDKRLINVRNLITDTFLGTIKENSIDLIQKLYGNLTISATDNFVSMLDTIVDISNIKDIRNNKVKDFTTDKISNELFGSLVSQYFSSVNGKAYDNIELENLIYGENAVGKELNRVTQMEEYRDNILLQNLRPLYDLNDKKWLIYTRGDISNDAWTRNSLVSAWRELLGSKDEDIRVFAKRLIDYSFYFSGFTKRFHSFYHHIPIDALVEKPDEMNESISYDEFISQLLEELSKDSLNIGSYYSIMRDVILNNSDIIPELENGQVDMIGKRNLVFEIKHDMNISKGIDGQNIGAPFIKFFDTNDNLVIGEYIGYKNTISDTEGRPSLIYKIVEEKGFEERGHVFSEFGNGDRTIVKENKNKLYLTEENTAELVGKAVKDFIYVDPEDRLSPYSEIVTTKNEQLKEESEEFLLGEKLERTTIQMKPDNIKKILDGTKTTTIRSSSQADKINIEEKNSKLVNFSGKDFIVTNRGFLNIQEAGGKESIVESEGLTSENQFKFQQTKDWINGKGKLYVYDIKEYIKPLSLPAEQGYESEDVIYTDVPQETLDDIDILEELEQGDTDDLVDTELENEITLEIIKANHGQKEYEMAKLALDNYNVSESAKKVWDQLKKCI